MSPPQKSRSTPLAELRQAVPDLADVPEHRALEHVASGLASSSRFTRPFVRFAGRLAEERGCATRGPVEVAPSTWAYRSATGTRIWRRPPTPAEVRECLSGTPTARSTRTRSTRSPSRRPSVTMTPEAARVMRIFN